MTGFLIGSVLLLALALVFVLVPLWKPSRLAAVAVSAVLALGAAVVYITVGTPMALLDRAPMAGEPGSLEEAVDNLAAHLADNPDELEGWVLLGRSRKSQERFEEAEMAFAQANRLAPNDPDILVEFAEAKVLASPDRRMEGEPLEMIQAALERDPTQQRALLLLGIHHQQAGRPAEAADTWERLLAQIGPEAAPALVGRINEARTQAGLEPLASAATAPAEVAHEGPRLHIRVELNPLVRDRVAAGATLYVIARQPDGPNMPVAVHRQPVTGFPVDVTISDASAMMPTLKLSDLRTVRLDARISNSGDAAPRPGDLEAEGQVVTVRDGRAEMLVIERVVANTP